MLINISKMFPASKTTTELLWNIKCAPFSKICLQKFYYFVGFKVVGLLLISNSQQFHARYERILMHENYLKGW